MITQSKKGEKNLGGKSAGFLGDLFKLGGSRFSKRSPGAISPLGGRQNGPGYLGLTLGGEQVLGINYEPGSILDHVVETYAGPHDYLNSWYWYDNNTGYIRDGIGTIGRVFGEGLNAINVLIATPFAAASVVPDSIVLSRITYSAGTN